MPNSLAPFSLRMRKASTIWSDVMPYLASPGLSIMSLLILNTPPGLYRQLMVSGMAPRAFSTYGMWVMSSRLIMAPSFPAMANSSTGVSLEENMISLPANPTASDSISSVAEEQSVPQPHSLRIRRIQGLGVAFTAKYSL